MPLVSAYWGASSAAILPLFCRIVGPDTGAEATVSLVPRNAEGKLSFILISLPFGASGGPAEGERLPRCDAHCSLCPQRPCGGWLSCRPAPARSGTPPPRRSLSLARTGLREEPAGGGEFPFIFCARGRRLCPECQIAFCFRRLLQESRPATIPEARKSSRKATAG